MKSSKQENNTLSKKENWGNVYDYLNWRGDLSFTQDPFNSIDGLIFTIFSYLRFPNPDKKDLPIPFSVFMEKINEFPFDERYEGIFIMKEDAIKFASLAAKTKRFGELLVLDFSEIEMGDEKEPFGAISFLLPDESVFVAFRGTDDTLVGWKESFNLAVINGTPSQLEAARYAAKIIEKHEGLVRLGGHSKGGNLAVYAAASLEEKNRGRLKRVFNYDGPGFLPEFLESESFVSVRDRIISFVPEASIVGVLMGGLEYLVINSSELLVMQHNPFSWYVLGKKFFYETNRSRAGKILGKKANDIIGSLSIEEREKVVEDIYSVLSDTPATTLTDIEKHPFYHVLNTLPKAVKKLKS